MANLKKQEDDSKINKAKVKGLGDIETPDTNALILHFLSPIERPLTEQIPTF